TRMAYSMRLSFFFQAEDGIRDRNVTGVQTCALPISSHGMVLPTQVHGQLDDLGRVQGHGAFDAEPGGAPGRTPGRTDLEGLVDRGVTAGQRIEAEGVRGGDRLPVAV